jgi:hypothetical protein
MESIMKRIFFPLFLVILICSFSLAYGEGLQSLRGGADIPADSTPAVDMDWQPPGAAVPRTSAHQPPLIPHDKRDGYFNSYEHVSGLSWSGRYRGSETLCDPLH